MKKWEIDGDETHQTPWLVFSSTSVTSDQICEASWAQDRTLQYNRISVHLKRKLMVCYTKYQVSLKLTFLFQHFEKNIVLHKNGISSSAPDCLAYVPPETPHSFWLLAIFSVNQHQNVGSYWQKEKMCVEPRNCIIIGTSQVYLRVWRTDCQIAASEEP